MKLTLALMASHDQESHFAPHFNCPDIRTAVGIMCCWNQSYDITKETCFISFQLSLPKDTVMPLVMLLVSCDTDSDSSGIK